MNGNCTEGPLSHSTSTTIQKARALFFILALLLGSLTALGASDYVVIVTVDGLRSSIFSEVADVHLPNFARLRKEGVYTFNARTADGWTYTNPNHVSILTARAVNGLQGHKYTYLSSPPLGATFHSVAGFYVTSVWDIAHDRGLRTGVFNSKPSQFSIIDLSYDAVNGALDLTDADNGRDKIDVYSANSDPLLVTQSLIAGMTSQPFNLSWLHLANPDTVGHSQGWSSFPYRTAVVAVDGYLGTLLDAVSNDVTLKGRTTLIVTTDHGGSGTVHSDPNLAANYTIPFFVWGAGVDRPGDLYFINRPFRRDPGTARIPYTAEPTSEPIRNAEAGNLALSLLGLPSIQDEGAFLNQNGDLRVSLPPFDVSSITVEDGQTKLTWASLGDGYGYSIQTRSNLEIGEWANAEGSWPITATTWSDPILGHRFYRVVASALPFGSPVAEPVLTLQSSKTALPTRKKSRRRYSGALLDDGITGKPISIPAH
jgi:hypothetical protein